MLPGTVHAALVIVFSWLVHLLFASFGIDLGSEAADAIAQQIVAYILSLVGLGLFNRVRVKSFVISTAEYRPPFTS